VKFDKILESAKILRSVKKIIEIEKSKIK